jgi:hypothetical protein
MQQRVNWRSNAAWLALAAGIVGCLIFLAFARPAYDFSIDDTFITMRYAKNLAETGRLEWNLFEEPNVEGYTTLSWVLLSALVFRFLPTDPFASIKVMSLIAGLLAVLSAAFVGVRISKSPIAGVLPAIFLALTGAVVLWGVSGMETTFYLFLIMLSLLLVLREEEKGLNYLTPVVLFLVAVTRTEGVVFYAGIVLARLAIYFIHKDERYSPRKREYVYWNLLFIALVVLYLVWKLYYYGTVIPLPVYKKTAIGKEGIIYVREFFKGFYPFIILALVGIVKSYKERSLLYLVIPFVLYVLAISVSNPIVGLHYRLILAGIPLLYFLSIYELDFLFTSFRHPRIRIVLNAGLVLALFWMISDSPRAQMLNLQNDAEKEWVVLENVHIAMGEWIKAQDLEEDQRTVALGDAGATVFYSGIDAIDMLGLNDVEIAKQGFSVEDLLDRAPGFIVLKTGAPGRMVGSRSEYGEYSDAIFNHPDFQKSYKVMERFTTLEPFYSLWIFGRVD